MAELVQERIRELTEQIEKEPTSDLYNRRGNVYYDQRDYEEALKDYDKAIELDPDSFSCHYGRGNANKKLKRYDEALSDYSKAIGLSPSHALSYYGQGDAHYHQKNYDDALKDFNDAIERDPNLALPYNGRGNVYYEQKRYNEALADYEEAIKLDPTLAYPYNGRGNVYRDQKKNEEALKEYSKAIELDPNFAHAYRNRGILYEHQTLFQNAIDDFNKARGLFGKNEVYFKKNAENRRDANRSLLESERAEPDDVRKIIDQTEKKLKITIQENERERTRKDFRSYKHMIDPVDELTLTVLRKWNSFTPIVGEGSRSSKGGGYFIQCDGKGIVVDPGFNFIENFMAAGYKFKEIDAVLITHAHSDHTADLDNLLTILYRYNRELLEGVDDLSNTHLVVKDGSILEGILKELNLPPGTKNEKVKEELKRHVDKETRNIKFYITRSTFKKYAGFFDFKESNHIVDVVSVDGNCQYDVDGVQVRVIKANHDDVLSKDTSVGFCFTQGNFTIIYTGDTGFYDMEKTYSELAEEYNGKSIVLLANIGGFKDSELYYKKGSNVKEHYYKNHLGRLGLAKLVEILKPKLCIISEFGQEFDECRKELAEIFNEVYHEKLQTKFLPADIGLRVKRDKRDNSIKVEAITSHKKGKDNRFPTDFIDLADVCVGEVKFVSQLYYYHKDANIVDILEGKITEFSESLSKNG